MSGSIRLIGTNCSTVLLHSRHARFCVFGSNSDEVPVRLYSTLSIVVKSVNSELSLVWKTY